MRLRLEIKKLFSLVFILVGFGLVLIVSGGVRTWIRQINYDFFQPVYFPAYSFAFSHLFVRPVANASATASSVPVLLYHGLADSVSDPNSETVATSTFRDEMIALKQAGWQTVSLADYYAFVNGQKKLPPKSFLLTFDDGRDASYYPADPVLWALGYQATMFEIEKYAVMPQNSYYLAADEVRGMVSTGRWIVEAHAANSHSNTFPLDSQGTLGPFFSNRLWLASQNRLETPDEFKARIDQELQLARDGLSSLTGERIIAFAYPFNNFGEDSTNYPDAASVVKTETHNFFAMAFFQFYTPKIFSQNYQNQLADPEGFLMKRIEIHAGITPNALLATVNAGSTKSLPFDDAFANDQGWVSTNWGNAAVTPGKGLLMSSLATSTGSVAILDGSHAWQDYDVEATVTWPRGSNIYLWGRVEDTNNYAACNFGKSLAHVEQTINGQTSVIKGQDYIFSVPDGQSFTIGMRIQGRTVTCSLNGQTIVTTDFLDSALSHGGIGLKTWDVTHGNTEMDISHINVTPL